MYLSNRKISYILREKIIIKENKRKQGRTLIAILDKVEKMKGEGGHQRIGKKKKRREGVVLANWKAEEEGEGRGQGLRVGGLTRGKRNIKWKMYIIIKLFEYVSNCV